jgi:hypothetical protein
MDAAADVARFTLQSSGGWLWWLCLAIVIGLAVALVCAIYKLCALPGEIARERGSPQASAIAVCGWLGLIFLPLWPLALIWAYLTPRDRPLQPPPDLKGLQAQVRAMAERIADIESAAEPGRGGAR